METVLMFILIGAFLFAAGYALKALRGYLSAEAYIERDLRLIETRRERNASPEVILHELQERPTSSITQEFLGEQPEGTPGEQLNTLVEYLLIALEPESTAN